MSTLSVGTPLPRVDGRAKVTGAARYAAEFNQTNQAHAVMITSTVGRGRIAAIDSRDAVRLPGVLAVLSHLNAPRLPYREHRGSIDPTVGERLHVFQDAEARFFGQPVAVVIAQTLQQAQHAAAALRLRYKTRASDRPAGGPRERCHRARRRAAARCAHSGGHGAGRR
jgi:xanthine dehydrogenase YagR molybdenum-binding subunit